MTKRHIEARELVAEVKALGSINGSCTQSEGHRACAEPDRKAQCSSGKLEVKVGFKI